MCFYFVPQNNGSFGLRFRIWLLFARGSGRCSGRAERAAGELESAEFLVAGTNDELLRKAIACQFYLTLDAHFAGVDVVVTERVKSRQHPGRAAEVPMRSSAVPLAEQYIDGTSRAVERLAAEIIKFAESP